MLTRNELERYDRQIMLDGFGEEGQEKLKKAKIFIAGAGGLGSPVSIYLAAAGVGKIRIVDCDKVELGNLNRQILYWDEDVGKKKVDSAREKLRRLNQNVRVESIWETIAEDNILQLKNVPLLHGAVYGFEGRATTIITGETPCLRCLYPEAPPMQRFPVIGVAPAVIGCIQATEAMKYLLKIGELLRGRLLIYDGLSLRFFEVEIRKDPECNDCSG